MEDKQQAPWWLVFVPCWVFGAFFFAAFLKHAGCLPGPPQSFGEVFFLLLAIALVLVPFASKIKLLNILEIEREMKRTRDDLEAFKADTRQIFSLMANVQASAAASNITNVYHAIPDEGRKESPPPSLPAGVAPGGTEGVPVATAPPEPKKRSAIEYKILNTLWNKQVEKFPSLQPRFTFRINSASPEFMAFREAGNRLLGEGLIDETNEGQFALTDSGLRFCAEHHPTFPDDMWFNRVPLNPNNLTQARTVLGLN